MNIDSIHSNAHQPKKYNLCHRLTVSVAVIVKSIVLSCLSINVPIISLCRNSVK